MRKAPSPLLTRSDDEWLIEKGKKAQMKASVGGEPNLPPTTGWKLFNYGTRNWEVEKAIICTTPSTSPPCCLKVSLSGEAKEAQGKCEGEYKSTGLVSMGRPVIII